MIQEDETEILIVGGGLGGIAAALSACRLGRKVIVTEPTDWIGGQLTAQAVPPDEHPWIEATGSTKTYRRLREQIREYYRRNYPLMPKARFDYHLNPGLGDVSPLCHEPRVALSVLIELLAPYRSNRQLQILKRHKPVAVEQEHDRFQSVRFRDVEKGDERVFHAPFFLDASEFGDLLELGQVEHVIGAESQDETGEPHALSGPADPLDQQAVTWCFAMDHIPGEDNTIQKPRDYDFWRNYKADFWPGPQLGWTFIDPQTLEVRRQSIFEGPTDENVRDLWHFRRILYRGHFAPEHFASDITLVNWPQIDYWLGPLLGVSEEERKKHLEEARQLSLSFFYWMQTEAPRRDGGRGYRGLRLRNDVLGTIDGLAKHVYVRESRRIRAEFTVLEQHIGVEARGSLEGAEIFPDSVGTGSYRIDLHPSTRLRTYVDLSSWPFQIPLGALIPIRVENLLPACKNIGTTRITNGCYRMHPVEWSIGEAAGALASYCLARHLTPRQVRNKTALLEDFQRLLRDVLGVDIAWPSPRATAR